MDETLRQLGELLLGSVPTIIFMVLLYGLYAVLVHRPLVRVLAERHNKTEGAIEKAGADIAAAEARTAEYEHRLRDARLSVYRAQEARRQQALQARASLVAQARSHAQGQIEQARAAIDKDKEAAQAALRGQAGSLAEEIIRTVLEPARAQAGGTR
jgi:F-type H+-transporting ATPase subunit b